MRELARGAADRRRDFDAVQQQDLGLAALATAPDDDDTPARAKPWSAREVRTLITMWGHSSNSEIAEVLGRKENAIAVKASRLHLPRKDAVTAMKKSGRKGAMVRDCLTCRTPFHSEGIHNRICDPCKDGQHHIHSDYVVQVGGGY